MEFSVPSELIMSTRAAMIAEAKGIIDTARDQGVVLRLLGGLAVRLHCQSLDFCERDHGDIDLVGHRRDSERIGRLFADLGYEEVFHVRQATAGRQLQFAREPQRQNDWARYRPHEDDHVDVFLDTFKMEHAIDLSDRLELDDYTVTVSDILITKLQITDLNEKDERDIFTLLSDLELGSEDRPGTIDVPYLAGLCASDWGLYHEAMLNLDHMRERLDVYPLEPQRRDRLAEKIARLQQAIVDHPKTHAWRMRAKIGTRLPWHETVEEQD